MRKTAPRNKRSTPLLPLLPRFFFSFLFSFRFLLFSFRRDVYCFGSNEFQRWNPFDFPMIFRNCGGNISLDLSKNFPSNFLSYRFAINWKRKGRRGGGRSDCWKYRVYFDRWIIAKWNVARKKLEGILKSAAVEQCAWFNVESFGSSCAWQGKLSRLRSFKFEKLRALRSQNIPVNRDSWIRPTTSSKTSSLGNFWKLSSGSLARSVYAPSFEREIYFSALNNFEI